MSTDFQRRDAEAQREPTPDPRSPIPNRYLLGLLLITLLSAFLRFYQLNQLPPGLWFDEAWSAVAARETAVAGIFPVYYAASFGGMHPAIVYLTRFASLFSNGHPLTIRYALAIVGTLTTLLSFFSYRAIYKLEIHPETSLQPATCNLQRALLGSLILTITFPFLLFTRMGFESSLVTPASLILFWVFTLAVQKNKTRWFVLTGIVLGLTIYSFDTARFLPFAITIAYWGIVLIHRRGDGWRQHILNFFWLTLSAIIIFIPLGNYYLRNWEQFTARAGITTYNTLGAGADSVPLAILGNAWQTIGGLILPNFGDVIARHNLPGRPVYDPFLAIMLILGLITLIRFWKRPSSIIIISWAIVMLIPVILTDGAPTYTRIFGAIPALAAIAALSLESISRITHHATKKNNQQSTTPLTIYHLPFTINHLPSVIITLLITLSLLTTANDYFNKWANLPQLFDDFQVADWQTAVFAQEQLTTDIVYLTPNQIDEAHPTFDLVLHNSAIRTFPTNCLVIPINTKQPITYIVKNSSAQETLSELQTIFSKGTITHQFISPITGEKLYTAFNTPQSTGSNQQHLAQFGEAIELIDAPTLQQETTILITEGHQTPISIPLIWHSNNTSAQDHTYFIHLYQAGAEDEPPVAQLDQQPCLPTSQWHEGEIILDTAVFNLPPNLPAGNYTLGLGWYTWPSFERLSLNESENPLSDQRHLLGQITITN